MLQPQAWRLLSKVDDLASKVCSMCVGSELLVWTDVGGGRMR